jgi:hypothetical protein
MPANCQSNPTEPMKAAPVSWLFIDVKFSFIAKHRGIWPAEWLRDRVARIYSGYG